jgi:hypothetical protein
MIHGAAELPERCAATWADGAGAAAWVVPTEGAAGAAGAAGGVGATAGRDPAGGDMPCARSRRSASVGAFTTPVGRRLCLIWNHCTDARVSGPYSPSAGPGRYPILRSRR